MLKDSNIYSSFQGKKILITGHTGFKGSWLTCWLNNLGATVKGISLNTQNSKDHFNLIKGNQICESIIHDIRDSNFVKKSITKFKPDFIFHLAAQAIVIDSYNNPLDTISTNISGTSNVLNAARFLEKPCTLILVTTDKVYDNNNEIKKFSEEDKLGGKDLYSASKSASELIIEAFIHSFFHPDNYKIHGIKIGVARAGNVIGGGDRSNSRIMPDIINSLENNIPLNIRNPYSVRPWQHVLEPLSGYISMAHFLSNSSKITTGLLNFGPKPNDLLSVKDLVDFTFKYWGKGSFEIKKFKDKPYEASFLQLDISKAEDSIGWSPNYSSHEAIIKTLEWYKCSSPNYFEYSSKQISEYTTHGFN